MRHMHQHHMVAFLHDQIAGKLEDIVEYHQNRIDEIKKDHASVDHDEAKKIEVSKGFSTEAQRVALLPAHARAQENQTGHGRRKAKGTALTRLSRQAAKLHFR